MWPPGSKHRLSSCGAWPQLLHGLWDPPGLVIEPVPPALAGGFLTTEQSGKPKQFALGLVHFMDFDKCMTYSHPDRIIQSSSVQFSSVLKILWSLSLPTCSSARHLTTTNFYCLHSFTFSRKSYRL